MTQLLAVVGEAAEAEAAIAGGADRLVVHCLGENAARELAAAKAVGDVARGRCGVALWAGEKASAWAALVAVSDADQLWSSAGREHSATPVARWAVVGEPSHDDAGLDRAVASGCAGIVLAADLDGRRLLENVAVGMIERFVKRARHLGLRVAVAGSLEMPDIPRIAAVAPDALVLDTLLRRDGRPGAPFDEDRLKMARDLVSGSSANSETRDESDLEADTYDLIFVRDWILSVHLGAYSHEQGAQRVRFSVEAEVARATARAADIRDVVTYDLIVDAIGRATAGHVPLVETIAEDIASLVLVHPRVRGVDVTIEKLDLGPGSLGCRLRRRRKS